MKYGLFSSEDLLDHITASFAFLTNILGAGVADFFVPQSSFRS
jgi:hypothetical protein